MTDILGGDRFINAEPIEKGWSEDKKYCVTNTDGEKYLLRITPIERYETRKALFNMLEQVASLGIPMCLPIEFGTCADGVYSIQSWIDGEDLEAVLPLLSATEQYVLGLKSGEILRKMHTIPASDTQEEWAARFNRKTNHKIKTYRECGLRFDGDDYVVEYIENNRHLLENRPQCFQHGISRIYRRRRGYNMQTRKLIEFLNIIEKLKCNTRHSWTSSGRQESVAEHCWRTAVMALLVADEFPDVNIEKVVKICLIHDFGEAITGDIPAFLKTKQDEENEDKATTELLRLLPDNLALEFNSLFEEISELNTPEAKLFKALDNMEALVSHNEASFDTWLPREYEENLTYGAENVAYSKYLVALKEEIKKDSLSKIGGSNEC